MTNSYKDILDRIAAKRKNLTKFLTRSTTRSINITKNNFSNKLVEVHNQENKFDLLSHWKANKNQYFLAAGILIVFLILISAGSISIFISVKRKKARIYRNTNVNIIYNFSFYKKQ